jgi:hypothetical protein
MKFVTAFFCTAALLASSSASLADRKDENRKLRTIVVEFETLITEADSFQPLASVFHNVSAKDGALGGFVFTQASEEYAQAYGGMSLAFPLGNRGSLLACFGIGIEQSADPSDHSPLRLGSQMRIETDRHVITIIAEVGGTQREFTEPRYDVRYAWIPEEHFELGVMARDGAGVGPRIDFWLDRKVAGVWAAPLYDLSSGEIGGMLTFVVGY